MDQRQSLSHLRAEGYALVRGAIDSGLCSEINRHVRRFKRWHADAVAKNLDVHGRLHRVVNLHLVVSPLARLISENTALPVCDAFFGEPAALYTSLYFERGSEQALHRDSPLFATQPPGRYLGVWVALDDVLDDNGPLQVVPRSHLLPSLDLQAMRLEIFGDGAVAPESPAGWEMYQSAVRRQCDAAGLTPIALHVNAGDVVIWHPETFHGGAPHLSNRTRKSLVMHVTPRAMPVGHMDVFFGAVVPPTEVPWGYYRSGTRWIADFKRVDFGHEYAIAARKLRGLSGLLRALRR